MSKEDQKSRSMRAVTISREYGSGGGEIARRLATHLGWQLLDHQIVERVAQKLGMSESEAEAYDEHTEGFVMRLLESMEYMPATGAMPIVPESEKERIYQQALRQVLLAAVSLGQVVIVGRSVEGLLAHRRDVLRVRVVAPFQMRVAYVMRREGLNTKAAQRRIHHKDRERNRDLQEQYHYPASDVNLYDLVINTGVLDLQSAVDLIALALERKANMLSTPEEDLGPGAGLAPYPTPPKDMPAPTR